MIEKSWSIGTFSASIPSASDAVSAKTNTSNFAKGSLTNTRYESITFGAPPSRGGTKKNPTFVLSSAPLELECDYELSPTKLYKLLESSEWKLAEIRAKTHPDEVRTWVTRRDKVSKNIRWRMLPLHASFLFQAPNDVVEALIDSYSDAVEKADDQGMLPLHLAFRDAESNEDIIDMILKMYPEAIYVKDKKGRVPLALAQSLSPKGMKAGPGATSKLMKIYANAALFIDQKRESKSVAAASYTDTVSTTVEKIEQVDQPVVDVSSPFLAASTTVDPAPTVVSPPVSPSRASRTAVVEARNPVDSTILEGNIIEIPSKFNIGAHLSELRSLSAAHEQLLNRQTIEHERDMKALEEDYEARIAAIEQSWKEKLALKVSENEKLLKTIKSTNEDFTQTLKSEHDKQMDTLRESLHDEVQTTKEMNFILREEVGDLKKQVEVAKSQCVMYKTLIDGMKVQQQRMAADVKSMAEDHDTITRIVIQQREELDTSYAVRDKLINTLLSQEDDDRLRQIQGADELMDIVEAGRDRLGAILKRMPVHRTDDTKEYSGISTASSFGLGLSSIQESQDDDDDEAADLPDDDISALSMNSN